jgi:16S rRNA (cytosine1402-N4)-methyltransferase
MEYHRPVLLNESIHGLNIKPDGIYVDVTYGGGGHSKEILSQLKNGRLVGFDQDEDAAMNIPDDKRFIFVKHNFRFLKNFLSYYDITAIDGLIADLGVSSHHFDTPQRGFSFRFNGNLDMRMNTKSEFSAQELVNSYTLDELTHIFREYGELDNARNVARKIIDARRDKPLVEIRDLLDAIATCLPKKNENQFLAKIFQAMRIEVNKEIDYLKDMLVQAVELLKPEGRLVVISYHSLEDRLVKNYMKSGRFDGEVETDLYGNIKRPLDPINRKVIIPEEDELKINSRARSAKLRIAVKRAGL